VSTATRPARGRTSTRPDERAPRRAARRLARPPRRPSRRSRRRLVGAALAAVAIAALYVLVIRDLPLFRVEAVELEGASSDYEPRLRAELARAARGMTTLHVREGELRRVAARYPAVVALETDSHLPNRLTVRIDERPPVGVVGGKGGRRVPVAADGTALEGHRVDRPLPDLPGRTPRGGRVSGTTRVAGQLAAGAPSPLAAWLERVRRGGGGWVVELEDGPELRFGAARDIDAKWTAAAAVLGARSARGARYVDLRLPDRPAAGGFSTRAPGSPDGDGGPPNAAQRPRMDPQPRVEGLAEP